MSGSLTTIQQEESVLEGMLLCRRVSGVPHLARKKSPQPTWERRACSDDDDDAHADAGGLPHIFFGVSIG